MKVWKLLIVVGAVIVAAAVGAVAIAFAGEGDGRDGQRGRMGQRGYDQGSVPGDGQREGQGYGWQHRGEEGTQDQECPGCDDGQDRDSANGPGTDQEPGMGAGPGMGRRMHGGLGQALQANPELRAELQQLMAERRADMQAWWKEYGTDPDSAAAQKALGELRAEHRQKMQELLRQLDVQNDGSGGISGGTGDSGSGTSYQSTGAGVW
jgi:hypothetical protein